MSVLKDFENSVEMNGVFDAASRCILKGTDSDKLECSLNLVRRGVFPILGNNDSVFFHDISGNALLQESIIKWYEGQISELNI